jgi:hypothetical protein
MAAARVFRVCRHGPEVDGVALRWETGSRIEADWACGFTSYFHFESFNIQKWEAIWLSYRHFVKD